MSEEMTPQEPGAGRTPMKIELDLLLKEMDEASWTSNAIEYVEKCVKEHETLVKKVNNFDALLEAAGLLVSFYESNDPSLFDLDELETILNAKKAIRQCGGRG